MIETKIEITQELINSSDTNYEDKLVWYAKFQRHKIMELELEDLLKKIPIIISKYYQTNTIK